jgi:hypothetical protein
VANFLITIWSRPLWLRCCSRNVMKWQFWRTEKFSKEVRLNLWPNELHIRPSKYSKRTLSWSWNTTRSLFRAMS